MHHLNEVKPRWVVNEAVEQVPYADHIILNKIDLVGDAELDALTRKNKAYKWNSTNKTSNIWRG